MTRILIIAPAWVGDMVMTQSLVAALRRREPDAVVDLLAPPWTSALGARMPGVNRTIEFGAVHGRFDFIRRVRFGWNLRGERHDRAFVLQSAWKSAIIPFVAGIKRRRGYVGELRYGLLNEIRHKGKVGSRRTVDLFVSLADEREGGVPDVPAPVLTADLERGRALAARLGLSTEHPVVALCPGAEYGPAKRWPESHFAALAGMLARDGFATWLFGSGKEVETGERIRALAKPQNRALAPVNLCGKTNLVEALDLLALTAGAVANDSGLMHMAAAIGRPVVAIYGSTPSTIAPPLTADMRIAEIALPCRPCMERVCPLGHLDCLNLIGAADVAAKLLDVIATARATTAAGQARA
jgi:heptosyltransferase-2